MHGSTRPDHRALAEAVRRAVLEAPAATTPTLRQAVAERTAGGPPTEPPYDELARQIGDAAYRTTDAQVATVRTALGTEKAAFEVILAAGVGAGLLRWRLAMQALAEANDAPS